MSSRSKMARAVGRDRSGRSQGTEHLWHAQPVASGELEYAWLQLPLEPANVCSALCRKARANVLNASELERNA